MHCSGRLAVLPPLFIVAALLAFACASVGPAVGRESPIAHVPLAIDQISVLLTTNPDTVRGCTLVGDVQGAARWSAGLGAGDAARKEAVQEVKQRAAGMKANAVLLIASTTESSGSRVRAEAYRCPATHD